MRKQSDRARDAIARARATSSARLRAARSCDRVARRERSNAHAIARVVSRVFFHRY